LHIPHIASVGKNQLALDTDENELAFGRLNVLSATSPCSVLRFVSPYATRVEISD
jgi:hypothetical protein